MDRKRFKSYLWNASSVPRRSKYRRERKKKNCEIAEATTSRPSTSSSSSSSDELSSSTSIVLPSNTTTMHRARPRHNMSQLADNQTDSSTSRARTNSGLTITSLTCSSTNDSSIMDNVSNGGALSLQTSHVHEKNIGLGIVQVPTGESSDEEIIYRPSPREDLSEVAETVEPTTDSSVNYYSDDKDSTSNDDSPDDDVGDEEESDKNDDLLYEGAQLKKKDSLLLIMAHFLRFGNSQEELDSMLKVIRYHLPEGTSFPRSKYIFNQHFNGVFAEPLSHVYCDACSGYIGTSSTNCADCGKFVDFKESLAASNYFVIFNISNQIQCLLEDPSVRSKLTKDNSEFRNAKCYKNLPMGNNDISITWGSDGAAIFKSSSYSIWPLTMMINELPYPLRRKHVLMGGLWFGTGKPHFPTFLKPVIEELNVLSSVGLNLKDGDGNFITRKVFPGALTCDSVARCQLQELTQYNGKHGCSWCHHSGEQVTKGNGHTNVYPSLQDELPQKRDHQSYIRDAQRALDSNSSVNGVKKPSIILLLMHFNIITGFVVDYMHAVCIGVVKTMTCLWLDNVEAPYYLGIKVRHINRILKELRPCSEISRLSRALSNRKYWKAHEWRAWLLHYSPVALKGQLPSNYYNHWMKLVTGVFILLDESASENMINLAELLLMKFVLDCEKLYGKEYITYNMHLLTHLAESVRDWGPLWSTSCFSFESMNHKLGKMVTGTQYVQKQISHKFLLCRTLPHVSFNCFDGMFEIKDYFIKTINHFPLNKSLQKEVSGIILRGAPKLFKIENNEFHLLHRLGYSHNLVLGYYKLVFDRINITTEKHMHKMRKRIDCYVCLKDKTIALVKKIFLVCLTCNQINLCGCQKKCFLYTSILSTEKITPSIEVLSKKVNHEGLLRVKGHLRYRLCSVDEFHRKCTVIVSAPETVVSVLPNNYEFD